MRRAGFWALAIGLICAQAGAAERRYLELTTAEFTLFSGVSEPRTREIAAQIAIFRDGFEQLLGMKVSSALPLRIYALPRSDWEAFAQPRPGVAGYFLAQPFSSDLLFDADDRSAGSHELMLHEYTHYVLRVGWSGNLPPFLDEGIAEVFSNAEVRNGTLRIEPREDYVRYLRRRDWIPFDRLLSVRRRDREYLNHSHATAFYAQSWATVYYTLAKNRDLGSGIRAYANELEGNQPRVAATEQLLGLTASHANHDISSFIRKPKRLSFPHSRKAVAGSKMRVRALTADESTLALAELLLRVKDGHRKATPLFDEVLSRAPQEPRPLVGRAWAQYLAGDQNGAAKAFDGLAARFHDGLDARFHDGLNASIHDGLNARSNLHGANRVSLARGLFQVAAARSQKSDQLTPENRRRFETARALFNQALHADPTDLESINGYVLANISLGEQPDSLIDLAERGYELAPRSAELAVGLAILHDLRGSADAARVYWNEATRNSHTASTRAWIDRLSNQ